jgi:ABC-type phosphate transport system substrate-binding protein
MAGTPVSVIRADSAPTAVAFMQYLSIAYLDADPRTCANPNNLTVNSDQAMISTVGSTPYSVGYADYNDAVAAASGHNPTINIMDILGIWGMVYYWPYPFDTPANITANWNMLRNVAQDQYSYIHVQNGNTMPLCDQSEESCPSWWDAINATNGGYTFPPALFRTHYYVTNGQPDSSVQNFINFVALDQGGVFQDNNMWSMNDIRG